LQHGGLSVQAGEFSVYKLQVGELGFGFVAEGVEVAALFVDGDFGQGCSFRKIIAVCAGGSRART
jgi:hypothetical protein